MTEHLIKEQYPTEVYSVWWDGRENCYKVFYSRSQDPIKTKRLPSWIGVA